VRRLEGQVEEEGLARGHGVRDEGLRLLAQHVGRVVRRGVPVEVLHVAAGAVRLDDPVVVVGDVLHAVPLAPAGRYVGRLALVRVPERVVAVQILPDEARPVAGVLQPDGERRGVVEVVGAAVVAAVLVDARAVRELAAQDARPARAAERRGHERLVELHALVGELRARARHDVGARQPVLAVGRVPALVVAQDEEDVRAERLRVRARAVDPDLEERVQAVAEGRGVDRAPHHRGGGGALAAHGRDRDLRRRVGRNRN